MKSNEGIKKIAFFNLEKETVLPSWLLTTVFFSSSGEQEGFFPFLFMSTCTVDGFHLSIWSSFPDSNIVFFFPRRFACRPVSSSLIWLMEEQWSCRCLLPPPQLLQHQTMCKLSYAQLTPHTLVFRDDNVRLVALLILLESQCPHCHWRCQSHPRFSAGC